MPILRYVDGKPRLTAISGENLAGMTMRELVDYESVMWEWAEKTKWPLRCIDVLNAIYREVEWRAQEREWNA